LLEVKDVTVYYDGALALNRVSLTVEDGKFVSVVGPNGAGKTTILRAISGLEEPDSGTITFDGERIDKLPAYKIVKKGIVHCPERRRLFPEMTVIENLKMGAYLRKDREIANDMGTCFQLFQKIQLSGVTVLLVEQDVSVALGISDRIYVIAHGRMVTEGTGEQLMKDRDVREIYLGI